MMQIWMAFFEITHKIFFSRFTKLLGGRHKEVRTRGTGHDPTSLKHWKGEGRIAVDVVLNTGIQKPPVAPEWF